MTDSNRYLSFSNLQTGRPVVAYCSVCDRRFEARPEADKRADDLILKVRADFDAHKCNGASESRGVAHFAREARDSGATERHR